MKKILGFLVLLALAAGIVITATDPNVRKRVEAKRQAEQKQKKEQADRKQQEWRDGWAKWMEEGKRKTDERVKQANEAGFDDGFRFGYMGGKLTRSKTDQAVPSSTIEQAAWKAVETQEIPAGQQKGFVRGFTAGWGFGWAGR